jgi:hypothetical protein
MSYERLCRRWRSIGISTGTAVVVLAAASVTFADQVASRGTTLKGSVKGLSSKGVVLESEYGEGAILIEWDDVEDVTTDGEVQVLHGEEEEVIAPLKGKRGAYVVVGEREVDVTTIHSGSAIGAGGPTWRDRMRSQWRYWDGNFDVGFNLQQSTTDTTGLVIGFGTTRTKAPTRLISAASYRYSTEKKEGQSQSTIENEVKGLIRGEYDFTDRIYGYGSGDAEYDGIERLSIRAVPKAGAGYTLLLEPLDEKRSNFLKVEAGGGWVYQKYFGGQDDDYFTIAFGALACYYLPYDSKLDWKFDYLPAVDDWADNYLIRTAASLTVPMFDPISAKATISDEYNNKPAAGAAYNSLFLTLGLSIGW